MAEDETVDAYAPPSVEAWPEPRDAAPPLSASESARRGVLKLSLLYLTLPFVVVIACVGLFIALDDPWEVIDATLTLLGLAGVAWLVLGIAISVAAGRHQYICGRPRYAVLLGLLGVASVGVLVLPLVVFGPSGPVLSADL